MIAARLAWRGLTELAPGIALKAAYLYCWKGFRAVRAYKQRMSQGELYPPFMFVALTNTCNLRCQGCWVEKEGNARYLAAEDLDALISSGKKKHAHYYTLLGGEPLMYPGLWEVFRRHSDCYFQVITNGMMFTAKNTKRLRRLGNVTPLISLDGFEEQNDMRRGEGVWEAANEGLDRLRKEKLLFGVATTATGKNLDEVFGDRYVEHFVRKGAMYLWYYIYRPVGAQPHPEYCLSKEQIVDSRRRLLRLRRRHPIFLIDTYWTAEGQAFCPAAMGLGFHIGPEGSIEICPPLSFATDRLSDNGGDIATTLRQSKFLGEFADFVKQRTNGCVILEHPQELVEYIQSHGAVDYSTRDALAEIASGQPRHSHDLPGQEMPEDHWLYYFLKKQVFFGMGALG